MLLSKVKNKIAGVRSAVVLLSGGMDSAVNLALASHFGLSLTTLTFDYGQRAAAREVCSAKELSNHFKVPHQTIALPWFKGLQSSCRLVGEGELALLKREDLDDREKTLESAKAVWVPNRNGIFINIAGAYAEAEGVEGVLVGFNAEEAQTFPDNSRSFMEAANASLSYSTLSKVRVCSYTASFFKSEIAGFGEELRLPWELVWSCYEGEKRPCQKCESCLRFERAREGDNS